VKELTVSDPSRKLSRILVTVPGIYNSTGDNFMTFVNNGQNNTVVVVDLPQGFYLGKSVTIRL
jgi:chondroitin AC lyase